MQIIHVDTGPSEDREGDDGRRNERMGEENGESKSFFWSTFCNIKAFVGWRDGALHECVRERGREDDRDAEETALLSSLSLFDVGWG